MTPALAPAPIPAAARAPDWRRWMVVAGLAVAGLALLADAARWLAVAARALGYPYDLDYGEGVVWQQMNDIVHGRGYAPFGLYPAFVYHYPPLYHLTAAAVAGLGRLDPLAAGRLTSFISTLAAAGLVARLVARAAPRGTDRRVAAAAGAAGALCLLSSFSVQKWAMLMRVDALALALSLAGLLLSMRAVERPRAAVAAALLFTAAAYAKQTEVAAPVAAFVGLWLARPRAAWLLAGTGLIVGGVALAALSAATDGWFLVHVVRYNMNRFAPGQWIMPAAGVAVFAVPATLALVASAAGLARVGADGWRGARARLAGDARDAAFIVLLANLLIRTALLLTMLKSGASDNYLLDWYAAVSALAGLGVAPVLALASGREAKPGLVLPVFACLGLMLHAWGTPVPYRAQLSDVEGGEAMARAVAAIRRSPKPVLGDFMTLELRAGRPVRWEPAIVTELSHAGLYDERAFAAMVRRRRFGFFLTVGDRGSGLYDQRYRPAIAQAIADAYPRVVRDGYVTYHLPPANGVALTPP